MRGDLTEGPVMRTLIMFSVPTLMSNVLQSLSGTINSIWVGRLIGDAALAATANANIVMFLVFAAVFGFGMAATVLIGQAFGRRDLDGARRVIGTAIGAFLPVAAGIAILGWIGAPALLHLLATPADAMPLALAYLRVIFVAMPAILILVILMMGLRGTGDARTPLIFMGVTVGIDTVLNPMLISGFGPFPRLGIAGSALSTIIASMVSFASMIVYVYRKNLPLRLRGAELRYLKPAREELNYIVLKGIPMGAQMLVMSAAGIIIVGLVNREGLMMTAAYGAAMQLFTYIQMPAMAIGGAVSAMAAQFIGAGKWNRLDGVSRAGVLVNFVMTGVLTVLLLVFDRAALGLFLGPDSPAVPLGRHIQLIASWNFVFFGVTMVYSATMRAGNAVWIPLGIIAVTLYPVRLGFYFLTYHSFIAHGYPGADAIWWSFPIAAGASLVLSWWFYRYYPWRKHAVAETSEEAQEQAQTDGQPAGRYAPNL